MISKNKHKNEISEIVCEVENCAKFVGNANRIAISVSKSEVTTARKSEKDEILNDITPIITSRIGKTQ
jgi:hypothetical protein